MRKLVALFIVLVFGSLAMKGQDTISIGEGKCGEGIIWTYDGFTLTILNTSNSTTKPMTNYTLDNPAPWVKKKYSIKRVRIEKGISSIGSCAFAGCRDLLDVEFSTVGVNEIGWGAFMNCTRLRNISIPSNVNRIGTLAFANCESLSSINIPEKCRVGDQAFLSCTQLASLTISSNAILGHLAFANEVETPEGIRHTVCNAEIKKLPGYVNIYNCEQYGLSKETVAKFSKDEDLASNYDEVTSDVDEMIPETNSTRYNTYALIIGNQDYRFVPNVPYAIHDARVFAEYCGKTLGIPSENIHISEDATKSMILDEEMNWLSSISNKSGKQLIVYYAGHGVPDINDKNKSYILPTDVRGTKPENGIALEKFYSQLGSMEFSQVRVFLDACFCGITRNNESVNEGLRGVEIDVEDAEIDTGNVFVFSAVQGNETAQGYAEHGHGLFTYYLLKTIQNTSGNIILKDLTTTVTNEVSKKSPTLELRKSQTPTTISSERAKDSWSGWWL